MANKIEIEGTVPEFLDTFNEHLLVTRAAAGLQREKLLAERSLEIKVLEAYGVEGGYRNFAVGYDEASYCYGVIKLADHLQSVIEKGGYDYHISRSVMLGRGEVARALDFLSRYKGIDPKMPGVKPKTEELRTQWDKERAAVHELTKGNLRTALMSGLISHLQVVATASMLAKDRFMPSESDKVLSPWEEHDVYYSEGGRKEEIEDASFLEGVIRGSGHFREILQGEYGCTWVNQLVIHAQYDYRNRKRYVAEHPYLENRRL